MRKAVLLFVVIGLLGISLFQPSSATQAATQTFNGTGGSIPDLSTTGWTITVSNMTGLITDVNVTVTGLTHPYASDLDIWLTSPDGDTVILLSDARRGDDFNGANITFNQSAASVLGSGELGSVIASGSYRPVNHNPDKDYDLFSPANSTNLNDFNGGSANGDWTLYIGDDDLLGIVSGSFSSWSLSITTGNSEMPVTPAAVEVAGPPPATACTDVNFEDPGIIRTAFENDADRAALSCRLLASGGGYLSWLGSPLTSSANVGNQTVLDLGVVAAVDIAGPGGFQGGVAICLQGSGHMIYLDASEAPRVPRLWSTWTTPSFPGYTCTTIYAPGTVVLVANPPR